VIEVSDRVPNEHIRLTVKGHSTADGSQCTMIVIYEYGTTWAIHGLGNPGVRLSSADMTILAETILKQVRGA
jgi:hypothetical protein